MIASNLALLALASTVGATSSKPPSPYDFNIPLSRHSVDLKMIRAATAVTGSSFFIKKDSDLPTKVTSTYADWAFLIEHPKLKRRVLFDLGIRKDTEHLAPTAYEAFTLADGTFSFVVDKDVPDQLVHAGVPLSSIDTLILSHSHFDHIGDLSKLPKTVAVMVGPGTLANALPGYPTDPRSWNLASDFVGHNFTEISFDGVKIAGAKSHDFFGDGSLFLLDAPGHIEGNIMALVRVTTNPSTFVLLAGDTEHHPALLRPSPGVPLPRSLAVTLPTGLQTYGTPEYDNPFAYAQVQNSSIHQDAVTAQTTLSKLQRFDARPDTWVIISHDGSLKTTNESDVHHGDGDAITLFPRTINEFARKGWKQSSRFAFLQASNPANIWVNATGV